MTNSNGMSNAKRWSAATPPWHGYGSCRGRPQPSFDIDHSAFVIRSCGLAALALLVLALPAWATAYTWSHAGADLHWATADNWTGNEPAGVPVAGDTLTFDNTEAAADGSELPDTGPAAAGEFTVSISGYTATKSLSSFIPSTAGASTMVLASLTDATLSLTFDLGCTLPAAASLNAATFNTAGTVACQAGGSTVTAAGNVAATAIGTLTNPLYLVLAGSGKTWSWAAGSTKLPASVTVNGTYTGSGTVFAAAFGGAGTLNLGASWMAVLPADANFWTGTVGLSNGTVYLLYYGTASRTNAALINLGSANAAIYVANANVTLTAGGGFQTTGTLALGSYSAGRKATLSVGGACSAGAVTLGRAAQSDSGGLVLASGQDHSLASLAIAAGNTGAGNSAAFGGRCVVSGPLTLAGIAADFASAVFIAGAASAVNGAGATSLANTACDFLGDGGTKVFTFSGLGACTPKVRAWCGSVDGGGNAGVEIHAISPDALCGDGT